MFKETKAFSSFSVDDVPTAKRFYTETLGLEVSDQGDGIVLQVAGAARHLRLPEGRCSTSPPRSRSSTSRSTTSTATVAELTRRGVEFEHYAGTPAETDENGIFRGQGPLIAWFKDPAGNVLSVIVVDSEG